jgi:hypothetical protein
LHKSFSNCQKPGREPEIGGQANQVAKVDGEEFEAQALANGRVVVTGQRWARSFNTAAANDGRYREQRIDGVSTDQRKPCIDKPRPRFQRSKPKAEGMNAGGAGVTKSYYEFVSISN